MTFDDGSSVALTVSETTGEFTMTIPNNFYSAALKALWRYDSSAEIDIVFIRANFLMVRPVE